MLSSPYSFSEPMSTAAGFSPEIIFVSAKRIFRYSPETYGASPLGCATGIVSSPQGVVIGFPGASISLRCPNKTIAPFSFPRYFSRSSNFSYVTPTTGPRTGPFEPGDDSAHCQPSCPAVRNRPWLQVHVRKTKFFEALHRPVAGLVELR